MKTKTKALGLICGFVLAAGITAGTSTFAWFQVSRAVTLHFTNFTLENNRDSINAEIIPLTAADASAVSSDKQTISAASQKGYDVSSGTGEAFYSPDWTDTQGGPVGFVKDVTTETGTAYAQFAFKVNIDAASGTGGHYDLYLVDGTQITSTDGTPADGATAHKWTRVAILAADSVTPYDSDIPGSVGALTHVVTFENRNSGGELDDKNHFLNNSSAIALESLGSVTTTYAAASAEHDLLPYSTVATPGDISKSNARKIGEVSGSNTIYFVVRVWLEGTENNNQDTAINDVVSVDLKIASTVHA